MKNVNLFFPLIPFFFLSFVFETSACSCFCFSHINYDSLLGDCSAKKGNKPDSSFSKFLLQNEKIFFGTIESVMKTGVDTEMVKIKIDTVIKGQINFDSLSLINVPYHGDCITSAQVVKGLSFMGRIDPENFPIHLRDIEFYAGGCGNEWVGYLYQAGLLIHIGDTLTDAMLRSPYKIECPIKVLLFECGKLFNTSVVEKIRFSKSYNNRESIPQYYSITGKRLNTLRTNSVILVSCNNKANTFVKVLKLKN